MAIVKMKKLQLMVVRQQKDELLRDLTILGCVEVTDPDAFFEDEEAASCLHHESGNLVEARSDQTRLVNGLKLLDKYAPVKSKLLSSHPEVTEADFLDDAALQEELAAAKALEELEAQVRRLSGEESKLRAAIEALRPWTALELPLETAGTARTVILLGMLPAAADLKEARKALEDAAPESELFEVSADKEQHYVVLVCLKEAQTEALAALRTFGYAFSNVGGMTGTAKENIDACTAEIASITKQRVAVEAEIAAYGTHRDAFKLSIDRMTVKIARAEAEDCLVGTDRVVCMRGWLTAPEEEKLAQTLAKYDCSWELQDPVEDEYPDVPVKLKNNKVTEALNMVTNMYSLPAYGTVDPNPLMTPFFVLFYGIMMADMGYGLLMMLASLIVLKKKQPTGGGHDFFALLGLCGVSTFLMGALTGGFFGDFIPQMLKVINPESTFTWFWQPLLSPVNDIILIMLGSLALGCVQILVGMIIGFIYKLKHGEVAEALCEEAAWWVIIGCGIALGVTGNKIFLWVLLAVLVVTQGYGKKGIGGKIVGIGGSVYNHITGYFGDILSYVRLMALMLAGAVIAQVFNTLAAIPGNLIIFFAFSLLGNALNFALNLLGCYVHDMRLQCLEFFKYFYRDGGRPFQPVEARPKYYRIAEQ